MPITDPYAVTQENATPERCVEVLTAYGKHLLERSTSTVAANPERARKVEHSLRYHESTLAYFMSFLLETDGSTDPVTDEVRWEIRQLRERYAGEYDVPLIEERALELAQHHARRTRVAARASVDRRQARQSAPQASQATLAPAPASDPIDALEAAMASMYGMTVEEYRRSQE